LDFASFGAVRFVAILRAGLALALRPFERFLRAAARFFAVAMAVSRGMPSASQSRSKPTMLALFLSDSPRYFIRKFSIGIRF
jgi:hypothetical protein